MEKIVQISGNRFSISLKNYENNQLIGDYPCIVFFLNDKPCEDWSHTMIDILPQLCDEIIELINEHSPDKFCFYTKDDNIYQIYKSKEDLTNTQYNVVEKNLVYGPLKIKASFYDKV